MCIFDQLDLQKLMDDSNRNIIGCPFIENRGGPIDGITPIARNENEHLCSKLCGNMFPVDYRPYRCPCHSLGESYIKRRFWELLWKHRKGVIK